MDISGYSRIYQVEEEEEEVEEVAEVEEEEEVEEVEKVEEVEEVEVKISSENSQIYKNINTNLSFSICLEVFTDLPQIFN